MPSQTIESPALVAVTGANGFIAQHCIDALLHHGYRVVGTARTPAKAELVRRTHPGSAQQLTVVTVADMTDPTQLLAALKPHAPAAVLHVAAPFHYRATDFERELMVPSVRGATAVLEACAALPSVRRVVQTNSFACINDATAGPQPGRTYTARDWSPLTYEDGVRATDAVMAYRASKAAAERAAFRFVAERDGKGGGLSFDLVSLCPAMVFGPFLAAGCPDSPAELNTSNRILWDVISGGEEIPPTRGPAWVDVRDVADAHVQALRRADVGGRRFLLAQGVYCNQELADVARRVVGSEELRGRIPVGEPGRREADGHYGVDASDTERDLGISWRGLEECLTDVVPQLFEIEKKALQKS